MQETRVEKPESEAKKGEMKRQMSFKRMVK